MIGRPLKFETPEELQKAIDSYFQDCDNRIKEFATKDGKLFTMKYPKPYTIEGLAVAIGVDRRTILNYEKVDQYEDFFHIIKNAKAKILQNLNERALDGDNNPAVTIFNLKNNYGYRDKDPDEGNDHNVNININYPE